MKKTITILMAVICSVTALAQSTSSTDVLKSARNVNDYFMKKYADPTIPTNVGRIRPSSLWTRAVYYEGLMALYEIDPDSRYIDYTDRWAESHKWTPRNGIQTCDADDQCCAQTYLDRYMMTHDAKMIEHVRENLDHQMQTPNPKADNALLGWWTWIDAIQMAMPVYTKMWRATGEQKYLDHGMKMYVWSRDTLAGGLFNEAEGLWWRDKDYVPPYKEPDGKNCYWSRGSGWVYAALVKSLIDLQAMPKNKQTKKYIKLLKKDFILMSEALLKCQREDGLWNPSPATVHGRHWCATASIATDSSVGCRARVKTRRPDNRYPTRRFPTSKTTAQAASSSGLPNTTNSSNNPPYRLVCCGTTATKQQKS